jgi:hypothetical protein
MLDDKLDDKYKAGSGPVTDGDSLSGLCIVIISIFIFSNSSPSKRTFLHSSRTILRESPNWLTEDRPADNDITIPLLTTSAGRGRRHRLVRGYGPTISSNPSL